MILEILLFFALTSFYILKDNFFKIFIIILIITISIVIKNYFLSELTPQKFSKIYIKKDSSFDDVSNLFYENKLISSKSIFKFFSILKGYDRNIKSGEFDCPVGLNEFQFINYMLNTKSLHRKITLIEGALYKDYRANFISTFKLDSTLLDSIFYSTSIYGLNGYLFPQTYFIELGITENELIQFLKNQTLNILYEHQNEIDKLRLTFTEILTLASIIQAECIYEDEMPKVSSVYHNRLKINMKLEADPTIQFLLNKPKRLLFKDLKIKSPYNTYLNKGLPPSPINNPGKAAILAAIYPDKTQNLFFVADGSGYHLFSKDLNGHVRNKKILDKLRKEVYRK